MLKHDINNHEKELVHFVEENPVASDHLKIMLHFVTKLKLNANFTQS